MSTNRFLTIIGGLKTLVTAISSSAGAADANKIIATTTNGRIDPSFMPVGVGVNTASIVASENLAAGDFINIWMNAGTRNVRKADASNNRPANGFVLASVTSGQTATVYTQGENTGASGLTPGTLLFLSATTAGLSTATAPSSAGQILQILGYAVSSTSLLFEFDDPVTIN